MELQWGSNCTCFQLVPALWICKIYNWKILPEIPKTPVSHVAKKNQSCPQGKCPSDGIWVFCNSGCFVSFVECVPIYGFRRAEVRGARQRKG